MRNAMLFWPDSSGGGIPAGPDRSVQFNNAGAFAGDSNALVLVTGELQLTTPDDAHAALIVQAKDVGQSAPITDFNFGAIIPGTGQHVIRGNGLGSFGGFPALLQCDVNGGSNAWSFVMTDNASPVGTFLGFGPDDSGNQFIQGNAGTIEFILSGGIVISDGFLTLISSDGAGKIGFFGSSGTVKPTVSGSKIANPALTSLMTALAGLGLVIDATT